MSLSPIQQAFSGRQVSYPPIQARFKGAEEAALARKAAKALLKKSSGSQRAIAKLVGISEGIMGNSWTKFAQSLATVWGSKVILSRSWAEFFEISFLEFVESAFFFFAVPVLGQKIYKGLYQVAATPKGGKKFDISLMTKAVKDIERKQLPHVLPVKAGVILAALGISAFIFEYGLSFAKNLLTEGIFRKSNFSDVVNLSGGQMQDNEISPAAIKAKKRIKQLGVLGAALLLGSLGLTRYGTKLFGNSKALEKLVKTFDFKFGENGRFGISPIQLMVVVWSGVASYLDAARDKLELVEILSRVAAVVAPYLSFGNELLNRGMLARMAKSSQHSGVLEKNEEMTWLKGSRKVSAFETLAVKSFQQAGVPLQGTHTNKQLEAVFEKFLPMLKAKNLAFIIPLGFGMGVVGALSAILSQHWTAIRFEHAQSSQGQHNPTGPRHYLNSLDRRQLQRQLQRDFHQQLTPPPTLPSNTAPVVAALSPWGALPGVQPLNHYQPLSSVFPTPRVAVNTVFSPVVNPWGSSSPYTWQQPDVRAWQQSSKQ